MSCKQCTSDKAKDLKGEIAIHFPGLDGLTKPVVWVFPKLLVCLDCGFSEFTVPERELNVLVTGSPTEGVVVSRAHKDLTALHSSKN